MTGELIGPREAAAYLGVDCKYLLRQTRGAGGPRYIMPSPRKILFRKQDLDDWQTQWVVRNAPSRE